MTDASARIFLRQINGKAEECSIDGQGRILLPQFLVSDTGIKKACVILGTAKHFEIWSEEKYDAYCSEVNLEESAAKVTEILK
jgi:MraZ protein